MDVSLNISFFLIFFVLNSTRGQYVGTDHANNVDENTRVFIREENAEMKKHFKKELDGYFSQLVKTNLEILSNLETLKERVVQLEMNLEKPSENLPVQPEIIHTQQPPTPTEVEVVNEENGTIDYVGGPNSPLRRKIWVFKGKRGTSFRVVRFSLQQNGLGANSRLSLWSPEKGQHMWNGSQGYDEETFWQKEQETVGIVILVTLLISPAAEERPSFKLKFRTMVICNAFGSVFSTELLTREGRQVISIHPNNTDNSPHMSLSTALIAPLSGDPFILTLKYLDVAGTLPSCEDRFNVYFLEEGPNKLAYRQLGITDYIRCGNVGNISVTLGN